MSQEFTEDTGDLDEYAGTQAPYFKHRFHSVAFHDDGKQILYSIYFDPDDEVPQSQWRKAKRAKVATFLDLEAQVASALEEEDDKEQPDKFIVDNEEDDDEDPNVLSSPIHPCASTFVTILTTPLCSPDFTLTPSPILKHVSSKFNGYVKRTPGEWKSLIIVFSSVISLMMASETIP
ncbi:hypothetical protein BDQ17DRAFT_1430199 [Cyathus striatus]|nr:hypothetical protein BDQ17DRAFT_1430199 [Cyathus striatus]